MVKAAALRGFTLVELLVVTTTTVDKASPASLGSEGGNVTFLDGHGFFKKITDMREFRSASQSTASEMTAFW